MIRQPLRGIPRTVQMDHMLCALIAPEPEAAIHTAAIRFHGPECSQTGGCSTALEPQNTGIFMCLSRCGLNQPQCNLRPLNSYACLDRALTSGLGLPWGCSKGSV